jgi:hypothetical protein
MARIAGTKGRELWRWGHSAIEKLFPPNTRDPIAVGTISGMDQGVSLRRSFWRFSLRELVLLLLALGALFGWCRALYERYRPFHPTPFYLRFNPRQEIEQYGARRGTSLVVRSVGGSEASGPGIARKHLEFTANKSPIDVMEICRDLESRADSLLKETGCQREGTSSLQSPSFGRSYSRDGIYGELVAEFMDGPDGSFRLHVFWVEFPR